MILATAASGRTGRSVVAALGRAGHDVRAFDIDGDVEQLVGEPGAAGGGPWDGESRLRAGGVDLAAKRPGRTVDDTASRRLKAPESEEHPSDQGIRGAEAGRSNHGVNEP